MADRFDGKVALVTGGGGVIGRATARAFAREGAVVAVAGRNEENLRQTAELIESDGGKASVVVTDITREEQVAQMVGITVERHGRLDIAFNNAGIFGGAPLADLDKAGWDEMLAINLTGTWLSMKHEIRQMRRTGGGVIINNASNLGAHQRLAGFGPYVIAKAGVSMLTRNAALEYVADGIRINAISPGPMQTPMSMLPGESEEERAERMKGIVPLGRVGSTDEAAAAVLWLASAESGFIVGHDLVLDGGVTA